MDLLKGRVRLETAVKTKRTSVSLLDRDACEFKLARIIVSLGSVRHSVFSDAATRNCLFPAPSQNCTSNGTAVTTAASKIIHTTVQHRVNH
jgi:hypothetical protein